MFQTFKPVAYDTSNSLRYLRVLGVSAVCPWADSNTHEIVLKTVHQAQVLECLGQPADHRRAAENAEVTQRVEFVLRSRALVA